MTPTPSTGVRSYFGKYRGSVVNNIDPEQRGRVQVQVPAVLGDGRMSWALPCAPYCGDGVGLFTIPPIGASIWVEFEGGDPDYPIWVGGFWETGQSPAQPAMAEIKTLKTTYNRLELSDMPGVGGITLEAGQGVKIALTAMGIEISNGQGASISLQGPIVSINGS